MSLLGVPDASGIGDTLEVRCIRADGIGCERSVFYAVLTVLFRGDGSSVRFAEVPGFYGSIVVCDELSVGHVHEAGAVRASFLVAIAEVLLEFIGIVGSVVGLSGEFTVLGFAVEVGVRSGCREDSLYFLFVIPVGHLGDSPEVVLDRELVDCNKLASFVEERYLSAEDVVVHYTGRIP